MIAKIKMIFFTNKHFIKLQKNCSFNFGVEKNITANPIFPLAMINQCPYDHTLKKWLKKTPSFYAQAKSQLHFRVRYYIVKVYTFLYWSKTWNTRSLVYKGMVYKVFFGPVLDFQKKFRVSSTGSGRLKGFRKYVSIEAQAHPQHFSLYLRQMNTQVIIYIINARFLRVKTKKYFKR